jgi:hypothetical protein
MQISSMLKLNKYLSILSIFILLAIPNDNWAVDSAISYTQENLVDKSLLKDKSSRPWWIGDLITVFGIISGVVIVIIQLGRQHKNELRLQKENYREQLRIQIYQEFSKAIGLANEKEIKSRIYVLNMPSRIDMYRNQIKNDVEKFPLSYRAIEFFNQHFETINAVNDLVNLIERYYIVDPRLNIFKTAFSVTQHDMLEAFMKLHHLLIHILPLEIPLPDGSHKLVNVINPTNEQFGELTRLINMYTTASFDLGSYLYDLNVEIQNALLSNLFPNKAPRRVPLDPKMKVVSIDPSESDLLLKYFEEETNWGKTKNDTLKDVIDELANNSSTLR